MAPAEVPVRVHLATDPVVWDAFVDAHPDGTVEHLFGWQRVFIEVFQHSPKYLIAEREGLAVGVLPLVCVPSLLFGKSAVSLPYTSYGGILAQDESAATELVAYARRAAREFGASTVEFRNSRRYLVDSSCREHKVGARVTLPRSADALWTSLDRKVRNLIRKPQKEGLVAFRGGLELLDDFYRVFAENMRDLGTPVFPRALFETVLDQFPESSVVVVRKGPDTMAAGLTLGRHGGVLVPWASALRRYRHLSPNMLLYWTMLEAAIRDGYKVFDFGRSTRGGGTHQFKLQWGATDFPLFWETVSTDERAIAVMPEGQSPARDALVSAWQHLPLPVANKIGPIIIRHVV